MLNICLLELFQFIRNNQLEQIVIEIVISLLNIISSQQITPRYKTIEFTSFDYSDSNFTLYYL